MIVTRAWLQEWVDLKDIETEAIVDRLNRIGLEVEGWWRYRIPEHVVVGHVLQCDPHPNADRLQVCKIDLGGVVRQIVCGAKNIQAGHYVAVAKVGALLPGGMEIKHAKIRGVESDGMVCSSKELGLQERSEGIMILDESIGALETGKPLCEIAVLNDDVISIELTANRGDCLSIYGVARELSAAWDRPMHHPDLDTHEEGRLGIGRILHFAHAGCPKADMHYRMIDVSAWRVPLLMQLRLGWIEVSHESSIEAFLAYATHASGVILRAYDDKALFKEHDKAQLLLQEDEDGVVKVVSGDRTLSKVGILQTPESAACEKSERVLLEASYIPPAHIATIVKKEGLSTDALYYRTSRGSEPDVAFGMAYLSALMRRYLSIEFFAGSSRYQGSIESKTLDISIKEIIQWIGQPIEMGQVVDLLRKLNFAIQRTEGGRVIFSVPLFRHDIANRQDIVEEIVRMVGIDQIQSTPFCFEEANRQSDALSRYRFVRDLRLKAVANGFFETVHFVFCEKRKLEAWGFEPMQEGLALLNPMTREMDALRPSLMVTMLDALARNVANFRRHIPLFEIGRVFDKQRQESDRLLLVHCGEKVQPDLLHGPKPGPIDLPTFVQKVAAVIGVFTLRNCAPVHRLMHPYRVAEIWIDQQMVGYLSQLHPEVAKAYDLPTTYFAECFLERLQPRHRWAKPIIQSVPVVRDLNLLLPQSVTYTEIKEAILAQRPAYVQRFYPIDRYEDSSMQHEVSVTMRFHLLSEETLDEQAIGQTMAELLSILQDKVGARLR